VRTTLDIEDDVLAAAKELARRQRISTGQVVSRLLRAALSGQIVVPESESGSRAVAGFRPFSSRDQKLVTNELIDRIRDQDGI
jgi:hypothetical protein